MLRTVFAIVGSGRHLPGASEAYGRGFQISSRAGIKPGRKNGGVAPIFVSKPARRVNDCVKLCIAMPAQNNIRRFFIGFPLLVQQKILHLTRLHNHSA